MNVLINTKPICNRKAGVGYYVQNLVDQLKTKDLTLTFSHNQKAIDTGAKITKVSSLAKKALGGLYPAPLAAMLYNFFINKHYILSDPKTENKGSFDIYHETSYQVLPGVFGKNKYKYFLANIYDLSPFTLPKFHLSTLVKSVEKTLPILLSADMFLVNSNFIKDELCEFFNIQKDRVKVIPSAPSLPYKFLNQNNDELMEQITNYLPEFPDKKFILYTGTIEPRKNLNALIKAFSNFKYTKDFNLIIAGGFGWDYQSTLKLPDKLGVKDSVFFLGYQPFEVFELLYNAADFFVYPSFYEGFGMPNVEAMQCGAPVITSNTSCLPEVVGDAALLFDPVNTDELTSLMESLAESSVLKRELREKGFARAKTYSWERIGNQVFQTYLQMLG